MHAGARMHGELLCRLITGLLQASASPALALSKTHPLTACHLLLALAAGTTRYSTPGKVGATLSTH